MDFDSVANAAGPDTPAATASDLVVANPVTTGSEFVASDGDTSVPALVAVTASVLDATFTAELLSLLSSLPPLLLLLLSLLL